MRRNNPSERENQGGRIFTRSGKSSWARPIKPQALHACQTAGRPALFVGSTGSFTWVRHDSRTARLPQHALRHPPDRVESRGSGVSWLHLLCGFAVAPSRKRPGLADGIPLDTRECPNYFKSFYGRRVLRIFPLYSTGRLYRGLVSVNRQAVSSVFRAARHSRRFPSSLRHSAAEKFGNRDWPLSEAGE